LALIAHFDLKLQQMDVKIAFLNSDLEEEVKQFLSQNFDMKDMGDASYVIGIKIHRDRHQGILGLSQENYINKVLERFRMKDCSPSVAPIVKRYVFMLAGGAISWRSSKQALTATFTMEAEFVSCFEATSHGVWLKSFISGLRIADSISRPLRIYCDNSVAHIDIKYLAIRERIKDKKVIIEHISTKLMLADN
ncbi:retrovirus-related pol polyprotein from transposon tnt 1-94, partial [Nicotiana attenuata]